MKHRNQKLYTSLANRIKHAGWRMIGAAALFVLLVGIGMFNFSHEQIQLAHRAGNQQNHVTSPMTPITSAAITKITPTPIHSPANRVPSTTLTPPSASPSHQTQPTMTPLPCGVMGLTVTAGTRTYHRIDWQSYGNKWCPGEKIAIIWKPILRTVLYPDQNPPPSAGGALYSDEGGGFVFLPNGYGFFSYTVQACSTRQYGPCSPVAQGEY